MTEVHRIGDRLDTEASDRLGELAATYLGLLLNRERRAASQLILNAVDGGVSIRDVYLDVFQATQREIGYLWQKNQVSVAQEHYCTAATQLIMSQLYPRLFGAERVGHTLVATCVGGELHEIGVRMVADFFEMEGWDTYYLGANTPTESILSALEMQSADVLALSIAMTFNVTKMADLIAEIRASDAAKDVAIMVGGRPFNIAPKLWQKVGADAYASDAQQAIAVVGELVN